MESSEWVPPDIDTERPSPARIYDHFLGGAHNFAVDRHIAEQLRAVYPEVALIAHANRSFLRRAVEFLVDAGVRQFLDIGSGIPTVGHAHDIAQAKAPESRIVFVDVDPVAVAHSQLMLADNDRTAVIQEDVRHPEQILGHPHVQQLLDLNQPVAVLLVALLHYVPDPDSHAGILARLTESLVPGSYLVISHATEDGRDDTAAGKELLGRSGIELTTRTHAQVEDLFAGWELVEPGVVWVPQWRPDSLDDVGGKPESSGVYAGVARKP